MKETVWRDDSSQTFSLGDDGWLSVEGKMLAYQFIQTVSSFVTLDGCSFISRIIKVKNVRGFFVFFLVLFY